MQDIRKIHQKYYQEADLQWKKNFILQHVHVTTPKKRSASSSERRNVSTKFYLPTQRGKVIKNVRVCRGAFLSILQESRDRVNLLCQKFMQYGVTPPETRGGDRRYVKYTEKRESVKQFIKTFKPVQSHYSRGKNTKRQYLQSELDTKKMWKMYAQQHPTGDGLYVEYEYFRRIFTECFNISFDSPSTDKCSTCCRFENQISFETNAEKKKDLQFQLKAHKTRAEAFYTKLRLQVENSLTLSYDCQKNLVLPKIPDQAAYYARQLYLFNFTICEGSSQSPQNKSNTFSYIWYENEYPKGCNQIASALHHRLCNSNLDGVSSVRLFSDGCGGQNKNKGMLGMLSYWLLFEAPNNVEKVEMWYPIVGHSFIPPDRVFGKLERDFKRMTVIEGPEEYVKVINDYATVLRLGETCPVNDWKSYSENILKQPGQWHFKFQMTKKVILTRNATKKLALVQGDPFYNVEACAPKSLSKKGKHFVRGGPSEIGKGVVVKPAKLRDVKRLLSLHFGENWEENEKLQFFKIIYNEQDSSVVQEQDDEDSECDFPRDDGVESDDDDMDFT